MPTRIAQILTAAAAFALLPAAPAHAQTAQPDTTFTYQGVVEFQGQPFTGTADVRFRAGALPTSTAGPVLAVFEDMMIEDGLLTVELDLFNPVFNLNDYLIIEIAPAGGQYVRLSPNQRFTPAPIATSAESAILKPDGSVVFKEGQTTGDFVNQPDCGAPYTDSQVFQGFTTGDLLETVSSVVLSFTDSPTVQGTFEIAIYEEFDEDAGPLVFSQIFPFQFTGSGGFLQFPIANGPQLQPNTEYTLAIVPRDFAQNLIDLDWCVDGGNPYAGGDLQNGPFNTDLLFRISYVTGGGDPLAQVDPTGAITASGSVTAQGNGFGAAELLTFPGSSTLKLTEPNGNDFAVTINGPRDVRLGSEFFGQFFQIDPILKQMRHEPGLIISKTDQITESELVIEGQDPRFTIAGPDFRKPRIEMQTYRDGEFLEEWSFGQFNSENFFNIFYRDSEASGRDSQLTLTPSGGLGLGTIAPETRLHVQGTSLFIDATDRFDADILVEDRTSVLGLYSDDQGDTGSGIRLQEMVNLEVSNGWNIFKGRERFGNGLIFSYNDGPLPNGSIVRFNLQPDGDLFIGGQLTQNSSGQLKDDVCEIKDALETLLKLRGVSYSWKESGRADLGFIAEEMAEVLPEIVRFENGKAAGLDYGRVTALLVEAVKDQQSQLDAVQTRLQRIEAALQIAD